MILDARRQDRLSPRLAIVALLTGPRSAWAAPYITPLALDVIGAMVGANGASLTLATRDSELARVLVDDIPAGVDLTIGAAGSDAELAGGLIEAQSARGFERIVIVAADTLGATTRILTTALSTLASNSVVTGLTPAGAAYLAGQTAGTTNAELVAGLDWRPGDDAPPAGRGLEKRARLGELAGESQLDELLAEHAKALPRLRLAVTGAR